MAAEMESMAEKCGLQSDQSLRAYYREFRKVVEASDVVLEVLDARDPLGCRCLQVEQAVLSSGTNKKLILVMNKIGEWNFHFPVGMSRVSCQWLLRSIQKSLFMDGSF
jgi:hypothetical protein